MAESIHDLIKRYYTKELETNSDKTVFDLFKWKKVDVLLKDYKTGKVLLDMKDLEFPEQYSQNACDIIASKYFRKAGVPGRGYEFSMRQVVNRMASFWVGALVKEGLVKTNDENRIFYDEIVYTILNQMWAPNSPQWFNTGLALAYGIKGEARDLYYYDEKKKKVVKSKDNYSRTQASACFILSIKDSLLGPHSITDQLVTETKLFKGGSGVGSNFSNIRAKGEKLSGGGVSSGLMSFLKVFDRNAGAIKSGGSVRRSASMDCIDVDHPEILDFITWKSKEEDKVRALGKMGYDMNIDGEAYETVSGQNSNNSIRFSDEFMRKVDNLDKYPDATITLKGRKDSSINKEIKVKEIWDTFIDSAHNCADPAAQFDDTFNRWHTCPGGEDGNVGAKYNKINSTNPCFRGDMKLLTVEGYFPFKVLEGRKVNIINKNGDVSPSEVWCSGEKEIYDVRLSNNHHMYSTMDHKYMTNEGECEAINLKGKQLVPYLKRNLPNDKTTELFGFMQGDGDLTRLKSKYHKGLEINIGESDKDIADYFGLNVKGRVSYLSGFNNQLLKLGFSSNPLPSRELPTTIDCWDWYDKLSFLRGLYSANGSILSCGRVTLKTTNFNLASEVHYILREFDIDSYITTNKEHINHFSNGDYKCKESYDLNINRYESKVKFYNMIGFIQKYKTDKLIDILLSTAPKITSVTDTGKKEKVYDFTEPFTHWGVVEGYIVHNCGEYAFLDDTACNLASINVIKFFKQGDTEFDIEGYKHLIHIVQLVLEASIYWGQFPTEDIARKSYNFRTTGLGISNLASLLMLSAYPYDSDKGRYMAEGLVGILTGESYYTSSLMAKEIGAFEKYKINSKYMKGVIENHKMCADTDNVVVSDVKKDDYIHDLNIINLISASCESFDRAIESGNKYGYRNAQVTVMAPTGTISFAMDCASTSIEPFFSHVVYKKLVGGRGMVITNPLIKIALRKLEFDTDTINKIDNDIKNGESIEKYEKNRILGPQISIFDTANKSNGGSRYISAMGHVKMVAAITPLISGAVSKTVNLPREATKQDFKDVIIKAWKLGVKGITLYRDGSKAAQPLNTSLDGNDTKAKLEDLTYKDLLDKAKYMKNTLDNEYEKPHECKCKKNSQREKMIGIRTGTTHPAVINGVKIYTTINRRDNGEIGEIYITTDREGSIITGLLNSLSKAISVMLQNHISPQQISKMLRGQKYEPYGFVQNHPYIKSVSSISDLISKIIDVEIGDFSRCQVRPDMENVIDSITEIPDPEKTKIENPNANREEVAKKRMSGLGIPNKDMPMHMKNLINSKPEDIDSPSVYEMDEEISKYIKEKNKEEILYGETCPNCGSTQMVQNGTCRVCRECGTTTGCS